MGLTTTFASTGCAGRRSVRHTTGGLTHAERTRAGLGAIRDGLGTEALALASGAPLQHAVGLVNSMRIGPDVDASWPGIQPAAARPPACGASTTDQPG